jgi:hypothetical protein
VLEPWIIEQIRRREEEERRRQDRPRLEVPERDDHWKPESEEEQRRQEREEEEREDRDRPQRGVVIIEM